MCMKSGQLVYETLLFFQPTHQSVFQDSGVSTIDLAKVYYIYLGSIYVNSVGSTMLGHVIQIKGGTDFKDHMRTSEPNQR